MAQRKKGVATRRRKPARGRKAPRRAKTAQRKAAKRSVAKAKAQTAASNAKAKGPSPKKAAPRKQQGEPPIEVIKVETVRAPAPGVVVVTEYESVRVRRPRATTEHDKPPESAGIPESDGK